MKLPVTTIITPTLTDEPLACLSPQRSPTNAWACTLKPAPKNQLPTLIEAEPLMTAAPWVKPPEEQPLAAEMGETLADKVQARVGMMALNLEENRELAPQSSLKVKVIVP